MDNKTLRMLNMGQLNRQMNGLKVWSSALNDAGEEVDEGYQGPDARGQVVPVQSHMCWIIHNMFEEFVQSGERKLILDKRLSPQDKNYLLSVMQCMGLKVKYSNNDDAYVIKSSTALPFVRLLGTSKGTIEKITQYRRTAAAIKLREHSSARDESFDYRPYAARTISSLTHGSPYVPKKPTSNGFRKVRESLPVFKYRAQILELINSNKFCIIKGYSGAGKSTQIPQYILEDAEANKKKVRILACLPENLAALAICDRVAMERGESVGYTAGYLVPLESRSSPVDTILNFVTPIVLLRAMTIPGLLLLKTTTHIILDEVHCRRQGHDFLLHCFRDAAPLYPHLKFIYLGENVNLDFLTAYLSETNDPCPELLIEHHNFQAVRTFHLEDILHMTWKENNEKLLVHVPMEPPHSSVQLENARNCDVDGMITNVWRRVNMEQSFEDFYHMTRLGEINVDYRHSETGLSMLMVNCAGGSEDYVKTLLDFGASINLRSHNGYTARDWAACMKQNVILNYLDGYTAEAEPSLLQNYLSHSDPNNVDLRLIARLVNCIHVTDDSSGAILVFLPSYADISELQNLISANYKKDVSWGTQPIVIHILHSHIQTGDHRPLFAAPKAGFRKIILSTNIGESCLTMQHVKFVIDSGKVGETFTNSLPENHSWNFEGYWISKDEAKQREAKAGLSGPEGVCFRMYTDRCYEKMEEGIIPEILYAPLEELCLLARAMIESSARVYEFFEYLPTPPSPDKVHETMRTLKLVGALEEDESFTELGMHIMDYSIDPRWAKAVLYSVIFKCLDPILTIAACMSYGNPFLYQPNRIRGELTYNHRRVLSSGTLSDHMALLAAFHKWESERALRGTENVEKFCSDISISQWNFEIVYEIRSRLLGQLRASGFVHNKGLFDVKNLNKNSNNYSVVRGLLVAALYPNICVADRISKSWFDRYDRNLSIDASSVISREEEFWPALSTDWMIFDNKGVDSNVTTLKGCTLVSPLAVALLGGDLYFPSEAAERRKAPIVGGPGFTFRNEDRRYCSTEGTKVSLNIDNWIRFFSFNMDTLDLMPFREQVKAMIVSRLRQPQNYPSATDEKTLKILVDALTEEDLKLNLKTASVGQWPKLVSGNLLSVPGTGFEVTRSIP